jgi:hypothetical protein
MRGIQVKGHLCITCHLHTVSCLIETRVVIWPEGCFFTRILTIDLQWDGSWGKTGHMGTNCSITCQDVNSNNSFILIKASLLGGKPSFPFDNHQRGGMGQNFNRSEPSLKDIAHDQLGWTQSVIQEDESNWSSRRLRESLSQGWGKTEVWKGRRRPWEGFTQGHLRYTPTTVQCCYPWWSSW